MGVKLPGSGKATEITKRQTLKVESPMKPEDAAKRLLEIANMVETSSDGRIYVEPSTPSS
jgi:hypothetical protein